MSDEKRAKVTIRNQLGMHARASVKFVQTAGRFQSEVFVVKDQTEVNGKSIMGLLTLVAAWGMEIELIAKGPDAADMVEALVALIDRGFDEGVVDMLPVGSNDEG